jgi:nuclear receptor subfamily 1 group D member 3
VPKREKARILAAMQQSTQNRGNQRALATELDDQPRLLASVLRAHMETCEFTREKVTQMRQRARDCPSYSMPTLVSTQKKTTIYMIYIEKKPRGRVY